MSDPKYPRVLIQLDTDLHPSVFDAVVAVDSGVEHLLQYAGVDENNVVGLVHGAMFTRGPAQLASTAIFIGGSDVAKGERLAAKIASTFFGPIRVSVLLDSNGANTTAVAAVLSAARHLDLTQGTALVLGGTGPVGGRVARLLLTQGSQVHLASRTVDRARQSIEAILATPDIDPLVDAASRLQPVGLDEKSSFADTLSQVDLVVACGAAGARLLDKESLASASKLKVAIDLNAVPPAGIEGIAPTDKAVERGGRIDYGAIGVGGLKMKIHRAAIQSLFTCNDLFLDASEIFDMGKQL